MVSSFNHIVDRYGKLIFFASPSLDSGHLMTISSTAESVFFLFFLYLGCLTKPLTIVNISEPYAHTNKNNAILRLIPIVFSWWYIFFRTTTHTQLHYTFYLFWTVLHWPNLHLKHVPFIGAVW